MSEKLHTPPAMSYGDYLGLDTLLASQKPRSDEHDELLFIIIHQASELWLKLSLHELQGARAHIRADDLGPAFKMIARVSRIQGQLIQSWDVLGTMTPSDYHALRPHLDGTQIMEVLGIGPGRDVGEAYKFLLEHRTDNGPIPHDEAVELLRAWWSER